MNVEHLNIIQTTIGRMADNCLHLKEWFLGILSAMIGYAYVNHSPDLAQLAFIPLSLFWLLDSYYLSMERKFRKLYDEVISQDSSIKPFSMDVSDFDKEDCTYRSALFCSWSTTLFYGGIALVLIVGLFFWPFCETNKIKVDSRHKGLSSPTNECAAGALLNQIGDLNHDSKD